MKYILLKGREGTEWRNVVPVILNKDELETKLAFADREKPYILWWLLDVEKLPEGVKTMKDITDMFLELNRLHKDKFVETNYKVSPFAGFFDMVATDRNWGLLKDWAK